MTWLPKALNLLRDELPDIDVTVSSDYSPDLADAFARGRLDLAFLRAEPGFDLDYTTVGQEPLVVLMPSDHTLASQESIRPQQLAGQPFVATANKARVLRSVVDTYLQREGVTLTPTQGVDNPAMVMSLVASTRGLTLIPDYVENLLPWSVVSRPPGGRCTDDRPRCRSQPLQRLSNPQALLVPVERAGASGRQTSNAAENVMRTGAYRVRCGTCSSCRAARARGSVSSICA